MIAPPYTSFIYSKSLKRLYSQGRGEKMAKIIIDYDKCDACGECADLCPMEILTIVDGRLDVQNPEDCNECEVCMDICQNDAIRVEPE